MMGRMWEVGSAGDEVACASVRGGLQGAEEARGGRGSGGRGQAWLLRPSAVARHQTHCRAAVHFQ